MRRASSSLITFAALLFVLWLIWSRLHIVIWVQVPWWVLVIGVIVLFLVVDYLLQRIFARRP